MPIQTIFDGFLNNSVQLDGILIPINSLESTLSRYSVPLVTLNDSDIYTCLLMGSGIALHYQSRYFVLCTRHQLKLIHDNSFERVALLDKDGSSLCTAAGIQYFPNLNESEINDLVLLDFTAPCEDRPIMKERFYRLKNFPPDASSNDILFFIASGFPSKDQNYDISEENRKIDFRKRIISCTLADRADQLSDDTTLTLKPITSLSFDPDGLSGGSAFVVQLVNGIPQAYLAGMIVRANNEFMHIIRIGYIHQLLDFAINQKLGTVRP